MPELFDLDSAFATLTEDVAERTHPRGAGDAIGASRKRRTALGASAAVALIAVGGAWFGIAGNGDKAGPVGDVGLPSPAVLDAAAMTAATEGWVADWHQAGPDDEAALAGSDIDPECMSSDDTGPTPEVPEPVKMGSTLLVADGKVAYVAYADFGSTANAELAHSDIDGALARCGPPGRIVSFGDGSVTYQAIGDGADLNHVWVANLDGQISYLLLAGSAERPSDETIDEVSTALMAALQADASYRTDDLDELGGEASGSASAGAPSEGVGEVLSHESIDPDTFREALADWSDWSLNSSGFTSPTLPCVGTHWPRSTSMRAGSLGGTAEDGTITFANQEDASAAVPWLMSKLASCTEAEWAVDSTTVPGAIVAWTAEGTIWVAQVGSEVALLQMVEATKPPAEVRMAVGKLVLESLG